MCLYFKLTNPAIHNCTNLNYMYYALTNIMFDYKKRL